VNLAVADFNGDGIADVAFFTGTPGTAGREMHLLLQCDQHDPGCGGAP
jgi:hypothetical protein